MRIFEMGTRSWLPDGTQDLGCWKYSALYRKELTDCQLYKKEPLGPAALVLRT